MTGSFESNPPAHSWWEESWRRPLRDFHPVAVNSWLFWTDWFQISGCLPGFAFFMSLSGESVWRMIHEFSAGNKRTVRLPSTVLWNNCYDLILFQTTLKGFLLIFWQIILKFMMSYVGSGRQTEGGLHDTTCMRPSFMRGGIYRDVDILWSPVLLKWEMLWRERMKSFRSNWNF